MIEEVNVPVSKDFLTTKELAARWRTTQGYLANRRYNQVGPTFIKIGTKVLYPIKEVEKYEGNDGLRDEEK